MLYTIRKGIDLVKEQPVGVCAVLFIGAMILHFFSQRPLWNDEDYVVQVMQKYELQEFAQEFVPAVSFPRALLAVVQAGARKWDYHVWSLRYISLLVMLGAFILWARLYKQALFDFQKAGMVLWSFTASFFMMYYAAELKPYAMDVFVVGIFAWFLTKQGQFLPVKELFLAGLLPVLLFLSYGAVFIFWMVPFNYLLLIRGSRKFVIPFFVSGISSLMCFALFYYFDIRHSVTIAGVHYWTSYFVCVQSWDCFGETFGEGVKRLATYWWSDKKVIQQAAVIFMPFMLYGLGRHGFGTLRKHKWTMTHLNSIGFVLVVELLVLGFLKKYPFTGGRLTLFLAPFIMMFIVQAVADMRKVKIAGPFMWFYLFLYFGVCYIINVLIFLKLYFS